MVKILKYFFRLDIGVFVFFIDSKVFRDFVYKLLIWIILKVWKFR